MRVRTEIRTTEGFEYSGAIQEIDAEALEDAEDTLLTFLKNKSPISITEYTGSKILVPYEKIRLVKLVIVKQ